LKRFKQRKRRPNRVGKALQRVLILHLKKLKVMNIAQNARAIASATETLFRKIFEPSRGGTGSMMKDPRPMLSKSPKMATVWRKPTGTENNKTKKPMANPRLIPGPAAEIIILSSSGSLLLRLELYP